MNTAINYADLFLAEFSDEPGALKNNIQEYPASSLSHVLLLCHLKKNNDPSFDEVAKQTGIYLQNPYWLQFQLAFLSVKEEKDLNDWFDLSKHEEKHMSQEWKKYLKDHPDEFASSFFVSRNRVWLIIFWRSFSVSCGERFATAVRRSRLKRRCYPRS